MMERETLCQQLLATARLMNSQGLNQGTSGNVSARAGNGFFITPSALPYDKCQPEDMVFVDMDGVIEGTRKPSSEWRMHRDIYASFPDAQAILHAHSPYCTTLACLERNIPAFHYMVAMAGGDSIPCAPYATFGTQALSDTAIEALQERKATLLAHHGMLCFEADLERVFGLAIEVETLARMYLQAIQVSEPPVLSDEAMAEVLARFGTYKP
ncbi:class II aldolase/adducin family protein [Desulfobulbus rhabdoformis]|uniref:class II aldolase/adducin family protein n=1 Tax=Desulfobulbus rhabdoformis TaxID=34032 RepID=UPI001F06F63B|nr:class II aldolase/adducin family protein [Desulfobulbus rhabdoformis]